MWALGTAGRAGCPRSPRRERPGAPPSFQCGWPARVGGTLGACPPTGVGAAGPRRTGRGRPCRRSGGRRDGARRRPAWPPPWPSGPSRRRAATLRGLRPRGEGSAALGRCGGRQPAPRARSARPCPRPQPCLQSLRSPSSQEGESNGRWTLARCDENHSASPPHGWRSCRVPVVLSQRRDNKRWEGARAERAARAPRVPPRA